MSNITKYKVTAGKRYLKAEVKRELWRLHKVPSHLHMITGELVVVTRNAGELALFQQLCNERNLKYEVTS